MHSKGCAGWTKCAGMYTKEGSKQRFGWINLIAAVHTHRWAGNEAETGRRSRRQLHTPTEAAGRASRKGPGSRSSSRTDPGRMGQALHCGAATSSGDVRGQADRYKDDEALGVKSQFFLWMAKLAGAASEQKKKRDSSNTPSGGATAVTFVARRVRLVTSAGAAFVARVVRSAHRVQRRRAAVRVHGTISSSRQRGRHATSRSIVGRGHDRRARGTGRGRVALRAVRVSHAGGGSDRHRRSVRRTIVWRGRRRRRVAWHSGGRVRRRVVRVVGRAVDRSAVRSRRERSAAVVDARRSSVAFVTRRRTVAALDRGRAVVVAATAVRGSVAWRRSTTVPVRTSPGASTTSTARSVRPGISQLRIRDIECKRERRTRQRRSPCGRDVPREHPSTAAGLRTKQGR